MSENLLLILLLYSFANIEHVRGCASMILPNRMRLDSEIQATVFSHEMHCERYYFRMYTKGKSEEPFYINSLVLNNSVPQSFIIPPLPSEFYNESEISARLRCMEDRGALIDWETTIPIDNQPGYLFIQLDKPVYTAGQQVKYRIMAVTEDLKWAEWPVQNPGGIRVYSETKTSKSAFHKSTFQLSTSPQRGIWKMKASFGKVSTESYTTFEVRDYVLPRFQVQVNGTPRGMFRNWSSVMKLNVIARYKTGRPVKGWIHIKYFAKAVGKSSKLIQVAWREVSVHKSGKTTIVLDDAHIMNQLKNKAIRGSVDLYAEVSAHERPSSNVVTTKLQIATIADYPYNMQILDKRRYFKPHVPYYFVVEVRNIDGSPAHGVKVVLELDGNKARTIPTDRNGRVKQVFRFMENPSEHQIKFYPKGYCHLYNNNTFHISWVKSAEHYIKVKVVRPIMMDRDLVLKIFHYKMPKNRECFLTVTSRGRHVFNTSFMLGNGSFEYQVIPQSYLKDMVPNARIVVYVIVDYGIVPDALFLELPWSCREELSVRASGQKTSIAPGDTGQLSIRGGANMQIGLVAMDKDLYTAHYDILTREKLFKTLVSHDMGNGFGDGIDPRDEFENSGFHLSSLHAGFNRNYVLEGKPFNLTKTERKVVPDPEYMQSYFPESWLFEERTLGSDGTLDINLTFPDSVGTWMIYAVGVSENGGVCVSHPEEVSVVQYLNLNIVMPSRVVVSEEVEIVVIVSNDLGYDTSVDISIATEGLCRFEIGHADGLFKNISIGNRRTVAKAFNILPEKAGRYVISVTVRSNIDDAEDTKEKVLVVVNRHTTIEQQKLNEDKTDKHDLIGEIFSNISPDKIIPDDFGGAESLALDVLPKCYALNFLAKSGHIEFGERRRSVMYGLTELMKYRNPDGAFCLEEPDNFRNPNASTWFTALVLKAICQTQTTMDTYSGAIEDSYNWLFGQIRCSFDDGAVVTEDEPRMIEEEQTQLLAELLTSSVECLYKPKRSVAELRTKVSKWFATEQRSKAWRLKSSLAIAKVVHALQNLNYGRRYWKKTVARLWAYRKVSQDGYLFWPGRSLALPDFESIETTAYCLMISLHITVKCESSKKLNTTTCLKYHVDTYKIAQWLIQWRDAAGHFVATTDSIVATEALLKYKQFMSNAEAKLGANAAAVPSLRPKHNRQIHEENSLDSSLLPDGHLAPVGPRSNHVNERLHLPPRQTPTCDFRIAVTTYDPAINYNYGRRESLCSACGGRLKCHGGTRFQCRDDDPEEIPAYGLYCLRVCIRYDGSSQHSKTAVRVPILSGFVPDECDLQEIRGGQVMKAAYNQEENYVQVQLRPPGKRAEQCIGFRIKRVNRVLRLKPATVLVKQSNTKEWSCSQEYKDPEFAASRQQSCYPRGENRFEQCFCKKDDCVDCSVQDVPDPYILRQKIDDSLYVFRVEVLRTIEIADTDVTHIHFRLEQSLKNCITNSSKDVVIFSIKQHCPCVEFRAHSLYWVMGKRYDRYAAQPALATHLYHLDSEVLLLSYAKLNGLFEVSRSIEEIVASTGTPKC